MRTGRRRVVTTLGMVLGIALLAGLVAAVVGRPSSPAGPVYTVAQVRAGLARQPGAWAGRTLLVRGSAAETFWATGPTSGQGHLCDPRFFGGHPQLCSLVRANGATVYLTLMDDSVQLDPTHPLFIRQQATTMSLNLAVQPIAPSPLIALVRRVAPLARFLPMQGQVPGGVSHLYRIRLQPAGSAPCARPAAFNCTTGVLVDAQP
jgi:hypothetical protein